MSNLKRVKNLLKLENCLVSEIVYLKIRFHSTFLASINT